MDQSTTFLWPSLADRLVQRVQHEQGCHGRHGRHGRRDPPTDALAGKDVGNESDINHALPCCYIGKIFNLLPCRRCRHRRKGRAGLATGP